MLTLRFNQLVSVIFFTVLLSLANTQAESITVVNPGFEQPDEGKIQDDFSRIPGWSQDFTTDSGVETLYPPVGEYHGFGKTSDGNIYQLLDAPINAGNTYALTFLGRSTWEALSIISEFYYLTNPSNPRSRAVIADETFYVTDTWIEYTLKFAAEAGEPYIGKNIGIQFSGASSGTGWYGLDEVHVTVEETKVEVKATNPSPYNGEIYVDPEGVLKWDAPPESLITNPEYEVYLGLTPELSAAAHKRVTEESYQPPWSLAKDTTYYWRVDVVGGEQGYVWSFTTGGADWENPKVTGRNKTPRHCTLMPYPDRSSAVEGSKVRGRRRCIISR